MTAHAFGFEQMRCVRIATQTQRRSQMRSAVPHGVVKSMRDGRKPLLQGSILVGRAATVRRVFRAERQCWFRYMTKLTVDTVFHLFSLTLLSIICRHPKCHLPRRGLKGGL